jgi:hypothetical protein
MRWNGNILSDTESECLERQSERWRSSMLRNLGLTIGKNSETRADCHIIVRLKGDGVEPF